MSPISDEDRARNEAENGTYMVFIRPDKLQGRPEPTVVSEEDVNELTDSAIIQEPSA